MGDDPLGAALSQLKKGVVVTCTITAIVDKGIEVMVNGVVAGFIRKSDLSRDRSEQRPDRFAAGEKIDAKITQIDKASRRLMLSVKTLEVEEEKKAMATYGSSDAGASLGDILGAAIQEKKQANEEGNAADAGEDAKAKPAKKTAEKDDGKGAGTTTKAAAKKDAKEDAKKADGKAAAKAAPAPKKKPAAKKETSAKAKTTAAKDDTQKETKKKAPTRGKAAEKK